MSKPNTYYRYARQDLRICRASLRLGVRVLIIGLLGLFLLNPLQLVKASPPSPSPDPNRPLSGVNIISLIQNIRRGAEQGEIERIPTEERPGNLTLGARGEGCIAPEELTVVPIILTLPLEGDLEYFKTYTSQAYPEFLAYYHSSAEGIDLKGHFKISQVETAKELFEDNDISLPRNPGLLHLKIPAMEGYALENNKTYIWEFRVYQACNSPVTGQSQIVGQVVEGWVERIQPSSDNLDGIWYDVVSQLYSQLQAEPNNIDLNRAWQQVLELAQLETSEQIQSTPLPCCQLD